MQLHHTGLARPIGCSKNCASLSNYKLDVRVHTSVVAEVYNSNFGHKVCKHLILNRLGISYFRGNLEGVSGKLYVSKTWIAQVAQ